MRDDQAERISGKLSLPEKAPYHPPTLHVIGALTDLVQGGGKSGSNADSDPNNTFKRGSG